MYTRYSSQGTRAGLGATSLGLASVGIFTILGSLLPSDSIRGLCFPLQLRALSALERAPSQCFAHAKVAELRSGLRQMPSSFRPRRVRVCDDNNDTSASSECYINNAHHEEFDDAVVG